MMQSDGKVVLVTGSGRGIGRAVATRFAESGARVIVNVSRSAGEARETLRSLPGDGHLFVRADVGDPGDVSAMMAKIRSRYGRLDVLVNNAGVTRFIDHARIDRLSASLFDRIYAVNLRGAFLCVQKGLPLLRRSPDALIVNIASIAATTAVGSNIAYCAMKAALVNMTRSLARALAPDIRVNSVSPGLTETGLIAGWGAYRTEQVRKTPLGRLATVRDVASAVYSLAADLTYVTGQDIVVDGGRTLA